MKREILSFILLLIIFSLRVSAQNKIRIACVGNSITYGSNISNREKNSYPAQLQNMLGTGYEVMNFGHSGATLLKNTDIPYWKTKAYEDALASNPDIVFIKLGTNDSKAANMGMYSEFEDTYKQLIRSFSQLSSKPRIILLLPLPSFLTDTNQISNAVLLKNIIPMSQKVAYDEKLEVINLFPLFADKPELLPDKVHPSAIGATIVARRVYEAVKTSSEKEFDIFSKIKQQKTFSNFNGYECADFSFNGRSCKVVKPHVTAQGKPWIWRARFWGHQPQTDIALLERGFHVVYSDAAELFGNAEAIDLWNKFYGLMRGCGLAKKVALEGMSRGGLYAYNWALANPAKVACVYADAPVLDLKSWPGGKGTSAGSKENWEIFKNDYKLNDEQADGFKNSPLDNAPKIARLGFPMLHVIGDADDIVPVAENTMPFEQQIKSAGGNITVIHKPGVSHHPHSLQDPTPIVNFILAATGQKINFAAVAAPGAEYRSGAGWTGNKGWWGQVENIDSILTASKGLDILFVGNSITQGIGGHRTSLTSKPGFDAFNSVFYKYKWECAGISGDRTQNVLWRLQNGAYAKSRPRVMVVTIGVNNFVENDSPEEITAGLLAIANWVKINMPSTKLVLTGPLPTGVGKDEPRRKKYERIHQLLAAQKNAFYEYAPLHGVFTLDNGDLDLSKFSKDGIHLIPGGFKAWAAALKPTLVTLLAKK